MTKYLSRSRLNSFVLRHFLALRGDTWRGWRERGDKRECLHLNTKERIELLLRNIIQGMREDKRDLSSWRSRSKIKDLVCVHRIIFQSSRVDIIILGHESWWAWLGGSWKLVIMKFIIYACWRMCLFIKSLVVTPANHDEKLPRVLFSNFRQLPLCTHWHLVVRKSKNMGQQWLRLLTNNWIKHWHGSW